MLVTHCYLHVTCTIWVWLAEMSDSLRRHNAKQKNSDDIYFQTYLKLSFDLFFFLNFSARRNLWETEQ